MKAFAAVRQLANRSVRALGVRQAMRLIRHEDSVRSALQRVPERLGQLANQATLVVELVSDVEAGRYNNIPWLSFGVSAFAMVYVLSPADIVPDTIPIIGTLDDLLVVRFAMRIARRDLEAYCRHKGYDPARYFAS